MISIGSTNFSPARRNLINSSMVQILRRCFLPNFVNSGRRAIAPSSRIISQITPMGRQPASLTKSTAASVWPARCSTPPERARSGKMWPGCTRSSGTAVGDDMTSIVLARSAALMPLPMPCAASTLTWKSVRKLSRFCCTMRSMPSCCSRSPVVGTQINPRPNLAMKFTAAGVTCWPAMTRSPSFSRSASSTTMTILPLRRSVMTDSMESKRVFIAEQATGRAAKRHFNRGGMVGATFFVCAQAKFD